MLKHGYGSDDDICHVDRLFEEMGKDTFSFTLNFPSKSTIDLRRLPDHDATREILRIVDEKPPLQEIEVLTRATVRFPDGKEIRADLVMEI